MSRESARRKEIDKEIDEALAALAIIGVAERRVEFVDLRWRKRSRRLAVQQQEQLGSLLQFLGQRDRRVQRAAGGDRAVIGEQ